MRGAVRRLGFDGASEGDFRVGGVLPFLVGLREPDVGVRVSGIFADDGMKNHRRLLGAPRDQVEVGESHLDLTQGAIEFERLFARVFCFRRQGESRLGS